MIILKQRTYVQQSTSVILIRMKIMVFGDSASGKSTFAVKLGNKLDLPIVHLDEIMANVGRADKKAIIAKINEMVEMPEWIIEGNAFTKDTHRRIEAADTVIVFDYNRFTSLKNHVARSMRIKLGKEKVAGGVTGSLDLRYYIPYILWQFPKRKRAAVQRVIEARKTPIILRSRRQAATYLVSPANHSDTSP